jgi:hypothetical protein
MEPSLCGDMSRITEFLILQNPRNEDVFNVGLSQALDVVYSWFASGFNRLPYWQLAVAWCDLEIDCDLRQPGLFLLSKTAEKVGTCGCLGSREFDPEMDCVEGA